MAHVGASQSTDSERAYDLVVWGNEPAGLWLLNEYVKVASFLPTPRGKQEIPPPPRVLWIRNEADLEPLAIPLKAARQFGISGDGALKSYSVDLVSKHRCLTWNDAAVSTFVPKAQLTEPKVNRSAIQQAILRDPSLLTWSAAMWKLFGRTDSLSPETQVLAALDSREWFYWEPWHHLSSMVSTMVLSHDGKLETVEKKKDGVVGLKFTGLSEVLSTRWVINDTCIRLSRHLEGTPYEKQWFDKPLRSYVGSARYPLRLRVEKAAIPDIVPPLLVFIDEEVLPEADRDLWPTEIVKLTDRLEIRMWVNLPAQLSLEAALERFRDAMGRATRMFPHLGKHLFSIDPPLGLETCHDETRRQEALQSLEQASVEMYQLNLLRPDTRMKWLSHLLPFVHCHLPYPLGTLHAADELIVRWFGKKRVGKERSQTAPPPQADLDA